ncbi:unnamed protein product [Orchesella dallaii]|uniref:Uncharacterized protein n=1 Tax=Orchesella dallaii TaxID=48710 RepID=A0ABP1QE60_9HEXA
MRAGFMSETREGWQSKSDPEISSTSSSNVITASKPKNEFISTRTGFVTEAQEQMRITSSKAIRGSISMKSKFERNPSGQNKAEKYNSTMDINLVLQLCQTMTRLCNKPPKLMFTSFLIAISVMMSKFLFSTSPLLHSRSIVRTHSQRNKELSFPLSVLGCFLLGPDQFPEKADLKPSTHIYSNGNLNID